MDVSKDVAPVTARVAANIKQARKQRGLTLKALSQRLHELGQSIGDSGLAKLESGDRKVNVEMLLALAIALQVTPNRLLLSSPLSRQVIELAPGLTWPDVMAWKWASGEDPTLPMPNAGDGDATTDGPYLGRPGGFTDGGTVTGLDWVSENRPHRPPVLLAPDEWRQLAPFEKRFEELRAEVEAAGFDVRALFDDTVFEKHDSDQVHTPGFDHGDGS